MELMNHPVNQISYFWPLWLSVTVNSCNWEDYTKGWGAVVKITERISSSPAGFFSTDVWRRYPRILAKAFLSV